MAQRLTTLSNEREIIQSLKRSPKSMKGLQDELGIHYYTIRRIMTSLTERGIVRVEGSIDRSAIYAYIGDEEEGDFIPRITDIINKVSVKVSYLLDAVGNEDSLKAVLAAKNLPKHVTDLLLLAQHADNGAVLGDKLDRKRDEITKDYLYIKNAASILEQLLKEPRFWDSKFLQEMTQDPDYNFAVIQQASDYYSES